MEILVDISIVIITSVIFFGPAFIKKKRHLNKSRKDNYHPIFDKKINWIKIDPETGKEIQIITNNRQEYLEMMFGDNSDGNSIYTIRTKELQEWLDR